MMLLGYAALTQAINTGTELAQCNPTDVHKPIVCPFWPTYGSTGAVGGHMSQNNQNATLSDFF